MSGEDQGDESKSSVKDGDSAQPDIVTRILSAARILELETQTETQTASVGQGCGQESLSPNLLFRSLWLRIILRC